jgi:hypothetical protein
LSKERHTTIKTVIAAGFIAASILPVRAADMTITLNDDEQKALVQILDLATKYGGLSVAPATAFFQNKLVQAANHAATPALAEPSPKAK